MVTAFVSLKLPKGILTDVLKNSAFLSRSEKLLVVSQLPYSFWLVFEMTSDTEDDENTRIKKRIDGC